MIAFLTDLFHLFSGILTYIGMLALFGGIAWASDEWNNRKEKNDRAVTPGATESEPEPKL